MEIHPLVGAIAALLVLLAPATALYMSRLPIAPSCPTCRSLTQAAVGCWPTARAIADLSLTSIRSCTRCGWNGRMRWKVAPERVSRNNTRR